MEFQPVLMAAGQGSRMRDLTSKCPKALLPIGNMPMMFYPIKMLKDAGFDGMVTLFSNADIPLGAWVQIKKMVIISV